MNILGFGIGSNDDGYFMSFYVNNLWAVQNGLTLTCDFLTVFLGTASFLATFLEIIGFLVIFLVGLLVTFLVGLEVASPYLGIWCFILNYNLKVCCCFWIKKLTKCKLTKLIIALKLYIKNQIKSKLSSESEKL